ncbi:MAG: UvrD-helicase domain-containing protein, partial [Deltaproteobacteria bacterium]|nr:UvrD-helicase domain-containing protein [Deltaproteobacteria bacterium]
MAEQQIFDAVATPFTKGVNLVEASAGTGKTYAIAMLVLRALVELQVTIDQVLVVTFTVATTEELKERIRARISCARDILRGLNKVDDQVLRDWAATIDQPDRTIELLNLALIDIDRIAIHTIHGFCQRMLTDQALESGQLYDTELVDDTGKVTSQLVQDFWRSRLYAMDIRYCQLVTSCYSSPEELYRSVAGAESLLAKLVPEDVSFTLACSELETVFETMRMWWSNHGNILQTHIEPAIAKGYFRKDFALHYPRWLETLENSFTLHLPPHPESLQWLQKEQLLVNLNGNKLRGMEKKQAFVADWPLPNLQLEGYLVAVEGLMNALRVELAMFLRENLNKVLNEQTKMSFDGLVTEMAAAVTGRNGDTLCRQIGSRYRIVLIDEFQDTDSAQWQIFSTIFSAGGHFLYLIGDPKQAIYRFRGADIFSYFAARDRADYHLTLTRNYRSHPGLLSGLNRLFGQASIADQPYRPVEAAKSREDGRLMVKDEELPALVYCQLAACSESHPRWSSGAANDAICQWVIAE